MIRRCMHEQEVCRRGGSVPFPWTGRGRVGCEVRSIGRLPSKERTSATCCLGGMGLWWEQRRPWLDERREGREESKFALGCGRSASWKQSLKFWSSHRLHSFRLSSTPSSFMSSKRRTAFRPCIDLHSGVVKQIVGSSLNDKDESQLKTNFVSRYSQRSPGEIHRSACGTHTDLSTTHPSANFQATTQICTGDSTLLEHM